MKLALFGENRLGALTSAGVVDVTHALEWPHDPDPVTAGWWRRLCRDYSDVRDAVERAASEGSPVPVERAGLHAPVLNPSKILAAACNYADHVQEMHEVQERTLGGVENWMMNFDVFLKAPSSISGPEEAVRLPAEVLAAEQEIHHESELAVVIGRGGRDIPEEAALDHVFGYTLGLDITVRSAADRSRRKSYDTFSPIGPCVTTADELGDPGELDIHLRVNGSDRQRVNTSALLTSVPTIISYASSMMSLVPGDVIFTGAPPGVGPIHPGDRVETAISGVGEMRLDVH